MSPSCPDGSVQSRNLLIISHHARTSSNWPSTPPSMGISASRLFGPQPCLDGYPLSLTGQRPRVGPSTLLPFCSAFAQMQGWDEEVKDEEDVCSQASKLADDIAERWAQPAAAQGYATVALDSARRALQTQGERPPPPPDLPGG